MSTRPCRDCGHTIGKSATRCPQCGGKNPKAASPVVLVVAVIFLGAFVVSMFNSETAKAERGPKPIVDAGIRMAGSAFLEIQNQNAFDWNNATIHLNGVLRGYEYGVSFLEGGATRTIPLEEFTKTSGARFQPARTKPTEVIVAVPGCDSPVYRFN